MEEIFDDLPEIDFKTEFFFDIEDFTSLDQSKEWITSDIGEESKEYDNVKKGKRFVDITNLLVISQRTAAKVLGISSSSMSKKWKTATNGRKWPSKEISKIDVEIQNLKIAYSKNPDDLQIDQKIKELQLKRKQLLSYTVLQI